jgi:hypothetical protein
MNVQQIKNKLLENISSLNSGHYLSRIIVLAKILQLPQLNMLQEARRFMEDHYKPAGLDELICEVSETALHILTQKGVDVGPVAWAVPLNVLRDLGLEGARLAGTEAAQANA